MRPFVTPEYQSRLDHLADNLCAPPESPVEPSEPVIPTVYTMGRLVCPGALAEMVEEWENARRFEASLRTPLVP